ncbi:5-deoxy-glucuronate isomerase [Paraglaciecola chathamensis]|uniref:5-deoxy-glucuronate isomerase n=1 Tax=Paraglaciecola chathamensis S18K6 TaxID=1127672 RepID=A0AAV3V688_9ALTE|nr:5-deoxy-glucuronate isomerase [Paraglaciecola chathamensis]GAC12553.1 5-deoxy-glucuronate isomerase [Paraglaciecola chathamensis S18K6]
MPQLLSKYSLHEETGKTQCITPKSAGWKYIGFEVFELKAGETLYQKTEENEVCLVLIGGKADVKTESLSLSNIGERMGPFERKKPYAVYVPNDDYFTLLANTDLEVAVCKAPGKGGCIARLITPDDIQSESRGKGFNKRFIHNILPETEPADSLLIVEVYTDEGNSSSYPSHKHDQDNAPQETYLEETYYHRIDPPQGFVFQRVYTEDGEIDESMAAYDRDVVQVPKGYHPVATLAGYNSYYLNVMAGPERRWCFVWEDAHSWINSSDYGD